MMTHSIDDIIKARKTEKVLGDPAEPLPVPPGFTEVVDAMIEVAGHAPFHKEAAEHHQTGALDSPVPWRFHVLDGENCRALLAWLKSQDDKFMRGKIPMMLAAAGVCIQVTWLPDDDDFGSLRNQEHLMAASAATQNLLLAATARGIANYWSSGGVLRDAELYEKLDIPAEELLVGSIFLFPDVPDSITIGSGKNRGKNHPTERWSRKVSI